MAMMPACRLGLVLVVIILCAAHTRAITVEKGRSYDFQQYLRARDCSAWGLGKSPVPDAFAYPVSNAYLTERGVINTFYYFKVVTYAASLETSVLIRALKAISEVMWNSWAHFHPTAVDTLGALKAHPARRQPKAARTTKNKNIALAFALTRLTTHILPDAAAEAIIVLDTLLDGTGITSAFTSTAPTSPQGIGNLVAKELIAYLKTDGWNADGTMSPNNPFPFADYTNFSPVNDEFTIKHPTRYQPLVETDKYGYFFKQFHTTPQLRSPAVKPWAVKRSWIDARRIGSPWGAALTGNDWKWYKGNVSAVLSASANLSEKQKLITEFFDNKVISFGGFERWYAYKRNWGIDDWIKYDQLSACLHDATILAWKEKIRIDTIRPASAIRYLRDKGALPKTVRSWGGAAAGFKTANVDPYKWASYMRTMPHSEFPSGTACVCTVWAEWTRLFQKGSDELNLPLEWAPGCSSVEQGVTPKQTLRHTFKTISEALAVCKQSRLWAGVHFQASIDGGQKVCSSVASQCFAKVQRLLKGDPRN